MIIETLQPKAEVARKGLRNKSPRASRPDRAFDMGSRKG